MPRAFGREDPIPHGGPMGAEKRGGCGGGWRKHRALPTTSHAPQSLPKRALSLGASTGPTATPCPPTREGLGRREHTGGLGIPGVPRGKGSGELCLLHQGWQRRFQREVIFLTKQKNPPHSNLMWSLRWSLQQPRVGNLVLRAHVGPQPLPGLGSLPGSSPSTYRLQPPLQPNLVFKRHFGPAGPSARMAKTPLSNPSWPLLLHLPRVQAVIQAPASSLPPYLPPLPLPLRKASPDRSP